MPGPRWVEFAEFDTGDPVSKKLPANCFERIAEDFLATGRGRWGRIGAGPAALFDGQDLIAFGIDWIEREAR
jgi:aminoglycoside 3-N-acetyltransferase